MAAASSVTPDGSDGVVAEIAPKPKRASRAKAKAEAPAEPLADEARAEPAEAVTEEVTS